MVQFHVATRTVQGITAPKRSTRTLSDGWRLVIRLHIATFLSAGLFVSLLFLTGSNYTFILLPIFLSLFTTVSRGYRFNTLLNNRPLYFLLTACLALIYYSTVILGELLTPPGSDFAPIILVTTVLVWSIILEPLRAYLQSLIERRFNVRNREAARAIEAFNATLREEIDLARLREGLLNLIQQTLQPYTVSFWVGGTEAEPERSAVFEIVPVLPDDAFLHYLIKHPGVVHGKAFVCQCGT